MSKSLRSPGDIRRGDLVPYALPAIYLLPIPLVNYFASPTGFISRLLPSLVEKLGASQDRTVAVLAGVYFLAAYPVSSALSIAGQTMGPAGTYSNKEPRSQLSALTGKGRRLVATHQNLMEVFPAWALAAVLVQLFAPGGKSPLVNLLALHALVYPISYALDWDILRSAAHGLAISSLASVYWQIATTK